VLVVSGMVVLGACVDARSAEEVKGAACDIPSSTSDGSCVVDSSQDPALPERASARETSARMATCGAGQICRVVDAMSTCVPNVPYDVGNAPASGTDWGTFRPSTDTIYAIPFTSGSRQVYLTGFRLAGVATGGACRMALYSNVSGRPSARLANSIDIIGVTQDPNGMPSNVNPILPPNTTYWIAASCGGGSVQLMSRASAGATVLDYFNNQVFVWGSPLPNPFFSGVNSRSGTALSLFLEVEDVP